MSAKKDVIRELRREILVLKTKVETQRITLNRNVKTLDIIKSKNYEAIEEMSRYGVNILAIFEKELAWEALSQDPNEQMMYLRSFVSRMKLLAEHRNRRYELHNIDSDVVQTCIKHRGKAYSEV